MSQRKPLQNPPALRIHQHSIVRKILCDQQQISVRPFHYRQPCGIRIGFSLGNAFSVITEMLSAAERRQR